MLYRIIIILNTLFIISCLPPASIQKTSELGRLDLYKDIHVYGLSNNSFLDIETPNIYKKDNSYYFGNFYYASAGLLYAIDTMKSNIINIGIGKNKTNIPLGSTNIYSINLVDSYSNIYYTTENLLVKEMIETYNMVVEQEVLDPDNIKDDLTAVASQSRVITITKTNYAKSGVVYLNKLSPSGKEIFSITIAGANELNDDLKIMQLKDNDFAVFRTTTNTAFVDIYNQSQEKKASYNIKSISSADTKELSYKKIVDISYMKDNDTFLILSINVEKGKIIETLVDTMDSKTGNIERKFTLNIEGIPIAINSQGTIISTGVDEIKRYIVKSNPFVSRTTYKSYINNPDIQGIKTFDGELFGFRVDGEKIIFYLLS